jgi:hypothetical protein
MLKLKALSGLDFFHHRRFATGIEPPPSPPATAVNTPPATSPANTPDDNDKPMTRAEIAAERARWKAEHDMEMAALRREMRGKNPAHAATTPPVESPAPAPKVENTPPPVVVPPPQSAEQKRIEELERRERERDEKAAKEGKKSRESYAKSVLKNHGINELGQRTFVSLYGDRIEVDSEGNYNFRESEDKITPLDDYLNLWPQTSEGLNFIPPDKLPSSDGLKPLAGGSASASTRASGFQGLNIDQIMEKKKIDPKGFSEYMRLYPGDFDRKSAEFALTKTGKR